MQEYPAFTKIPSVPVTYALQLVAILEQRGVSQEKLLKAANFPADLLSQPDTRLTLAQFSDLIDEGKRQANEPALGYLLGLELKPSAHGVLGYALMTCKNIREAVLLAERFMSLRTNVLDIRFSEEGTTGVLEFGLVGYLGPYRQLAIEIVTSAVLRVAHFLLGKISASTEIWVDYPEPAYYKEWQDKLPKVRFDMSTIQLRFPTEVLDRSLALADLMSQKEAVAKLEKELVRMETTSDIASRIRAIMDLSQEEFPSLGLVSEKLSMSSSTLKRRLQQQGITFQQLLDEARCARALTLLDNPALSIERVAQSMGYADSANFTRAFKKWTGKSPSAWRESQSPSP